jgi:hypothetical protein
MDAYTIPQAARATGLSPREVRLRIEEGRLRAISIGGRRAVEVAELERAGLLGDGPSPQPDPVSPEVMPELVERLETQAGELAVLRRASAERRTHDERERRRLEGELAQARRELQEARARISQLEAAGFRRSLGVHADRPALTPLFQPTEEEPPEDQRPAT